MSRRMPFEPIRTNFRVQADMCCDLCRRLPGPGPWCGRCGRLMSRDWPREAEEYRYTEPCEICEIRLEAEWPAAAGGVGETP